ncbi:acylneuraminate cytidylyltransferase [Planktomarina temperata]|nr:acylneuraminate cytidylyltransferase [Planktomarina temperata]MDB2459787.1 acylneuraminate cytidylyltransferase [Planktomarina temperata]
MKMVILARGGSKGVLRKNLQKVNGISLTARSIIAAKNSECVSEIIVSTDSEEIASEAKKFGALVHKRSVKAASDKASTEDALDDFLQSSFMSHDDEQFFGYIQPTNPFIKSSEIDAAFGIISNHLNISTIFSARRHHGFLWESEQGEYKISEGINHNFRIPRSRRQDDNKLEYEEDGGFYILNKIEYERTRNRFGSAPYAFESVVNFPIEIDSYLDLKMCQTLAPIFDHTLVASILPKLVIADFDGVFTDDKVYVDDKGREAISANRSDGIGVKKIREKGIPLIILSSEVNKVASYRAEKMGVEIILGERDKLARAKDISDRLKIDLCDICFVGNDINDLPLLKRVGIPLMPLNAAPELFQYGFGIIPRKGGEGVIRCLADLIL